MPAGALTGRPITEREELKRLRRENHRLRQERDILVKAAAWFARVSKASPNGLPVHNFPLSDRRAGFVTQGSTELGYCRSFRTAIKCG
jgi:hypothetical protein